MKVLKFMLSSFLLVALFACNSKKVDIVTSTENNPWVVSNNVTLKSIEGNPDIIIDRSKTGQEIEGWGGCFNELAWVALNKLSEADRQSVMSEFFEPDKGANFNICRMPVAANDFSRDWYSYNETEGDFDMELFSIKNDLETLVPYINEAQEYLPELKIWASPWSPPSWMKYNKHYACATSPTDMKEIYRNDLPKERQGAEGTNMFIQEESYFSAYALYFSKFIDAYAEQGIDISMVMPQNEFNSCQNFPSCTWTAAGLAEFIGLHLGPSMEAQGVEVMFGTMERPTEEFVDTILNDSLAGKYIGGVGFQWGGKEAIPGLHKRYPNLKLYQTEQECGDGKNDWKHCLYAWDLMKHYISNGTNSYLYWNMVLEEGGVSRWGWSQNSLVTVHADKTFSYNHEYYLMKHVSHFVKPGAKRLLLSGKFDNVLAFENVDKSIVVVLHNENTEAKSVSYSLDGKAFSVNIEPKSFATLILN